MQSRKGRIDEKRNCRDRKVEDNAKKKTEVGPKKGGDNRKMQLDRSRGGDEFRWQVKEEDSGEKRIHLLLGIWCTRGGGK